MDLLLKRYASPFPFLDGMIRAGRFEEFVRNFVKAVHDEEEEKTQWEFFLHRVYDKSFADFRKAMVTDQHNRNMSGFEMETTVQNSLRILGNFDPEGGEENSN